MEHGQYHFGGPADSGSPVALRHPLAGDLPFRLLLVVNMDEPVLHVNRLLPKGVRTAYPHQSATNQPLCNHTVVTRKREGPMFAYSTLAPSVWSPCTVFSQKEGVNTSCHAAFTAAIDIMIQ
jgi:hypothetical protein